MAQVYLSGVMVTYNEEDLVVPTITQMLPHVGEMIVVDGGSKDQTVARLLQLRDTHPLGHKLVLKRNTFRDHYGDQKNVACSLATGRWILFIDPDEGFEDGFFEALPGWLQQAEKQGVEVGFVPRKNYLDGELQNDITVDSDRQLRLFRSYCRHVYRIHHEVVGWKRSDHYPKCLLHYKTGARQKEQNIRYRILSTKYRFTEPDGGE